MSPGEGNRIDKVIWWTCCVIVGRRRRYWVSCCLCLHCDRIMSRYMLQHVLLEQWYPFTVIHSFRMQRNMIWLVPDVNSWRSMKWKWYLRGGVNSWGQLTVFISVKCTVTYCCQKPETYLVCLVKLMLILSPYSWTRGLWGGLSHASRSVRIPLHTQSDWGNGDCCVRGIQKMQVCELELHISAWLLR